MPLAKPSEILLPVLCLASAITLAQNPPAKPAFEVASVNNAKVPLEATSITLSPLNRDPRVEFGSAKGAASAAPDPLRDIFAALQSRLDSAKARSKC